MSRHPVLRFWATAVGAALVVTLVTALFLPYEALGLTAPGDRGRAWLLCLWTGGVMSILFGLSGLAGLIAPLGVREVHEAGGVKEAIEARRRQKRIGEGYHRNFAWWLVATGVMLIVAYFVVWAAGPGANV